MKFASMYCDYIARIDGLFRNDRETARALWDKVEQLETDMQRTKENKMLSETGKRANIESIEQALFLARRNADEFFKETARKWAAMADEMMREPWARRYSMNPAEIDSRLLAILNSGLCTADELETLADEYSDNKTMCRFIAAALRQDAPNHEETRRAAMLARALELDGDKPAEVQAAENMLTLIQAGLRSNRTLSDGVANNLYDAAYNEAVKAADGITGETGSRLVTSADV